MVAIAWDAVGSRVYEAGIDKAVLYVDGAIGVPWNGFTGLDEDLSGKTSTPYYIDGVKYMDSVTSQDYVATLKAFTYPNEFLAAEGIAEVDGGVYLDNQPPKTFDLCYRTRVGNDVSGLSHYKLHLVYGLTCVPDNKSYETIGSTAAANEFSWQVTGVPQRVTGRRPTAHAIIDSRTADASALAYLGVFFYGSGGSDATMPELQFVIDTFAAV